MQRGSEALKQGTRARKALKVKENLTKLFDITFCQCLNFASSCCSKEMKVPKREQTFLTDQRTTRKMLIGELDRKVSKVNKRKHERENQQLLERREKEKRQRFEREKQLSSCGSELAFDVDIDAVSSCSNNGSNTFNEELSDLLQEDRNSNPIPTIALDADRYDVSNRAAAAIITAALIDFGVVSAENRTHIIDSNKVWRARQKIKKNVNEDEVFHQDDLFAIFFEGRKDLTLFKEKVDDRWYSKTRNEDHYVLVGEPKMVYLDYITLERGTGAEIADGLYKYVKKEMSFGDKLRATGADGTAINTGNKNGAIRLLECHLKRALQWFICSLHVNELPMRHLCKKLIEPSEQGVKILLRFRFKKFNF